MNIEMAHFTRAVACPRAAIEICKQSGPRQDCRRIRRSAFSRGTIIRIP